MKVSKDVVIRRYTTTMDGASKRSKDFSLTLLYLKNILNQDFCAYSGIEFSVKAHTGGKQHDYMLSLERIDNDKGYVPGNVIPVCSVLNNIRGSKSLADLRNELKVAKSNLERAIDSGELTQEKKLSFLGQDVKTAVDTFEKAIKVNYGKIKNAERMIEIYEKKRDQKNLPNWDVEIERVKLSIAARHGKIANAREQIRICIDTNFEKIKHPRSSIKALEEHIANISRTIEGIRKFDALTKEDKKRLALGLPLDASWFACIKAKIAYKIFNVIM